MDEAAFEAAWAAVARDREHGASELARTCLGILARSAREADAATVESLHEMLRVRAEVLAAARPSMAPIRNLLGRWQAALAESRDTSPAAASARAAAEADRLAAASRAATAAAAQHAARHLAGKRVLITLSWSSTVLAALRLLGTARPEVVVAESRPLNEGVALARTLEEAGLRTTLITDAQMGHFAGHADAALVGADALLADGAAVNKAGTHLLALACREAGVPFHVCCEGFKHLADATGPPTLEEKDGAELGIEVPPGGRVRNVYFDLTPAHLIDAWITENGVFRPPLRRRQTLPGGAGRKGGGAATGIRGGPSPYSPDRTGKIGGEGDV